MGSSRSSSRFVVGDRVFLNVMALDGLKKPGTVTGFVPSGDREGQPVVEWDDKPGMFMVSEVFLWPVEGYEADLAASHIGSRGLGY